MPQSIITFKSMFQVLVKADAPDDVAELSQVAELRQKARAILGYAAMSDETTFLSRASAA